MRIFCVLSAVELYVFAFEESLSEFPVFTLQVQFFQSSGMFLCESISKCVIRDSLKSSLVQLMTWRFAFQISVALFLCVFKDKFSIVRYETNKGESCFQ